VVALFEEAVQPTTSLGSLETVSSYHRRFRRPSLFRLVRAAALAHHVHVCTRNPASFSYVLRLYQTIPLALSKSLVYANKMDSPFMLAKVVLALVFLAPFTTASTNATCYFPNGQVAATFGQLYVPCKDIVAGGVTYCCDPDDACTTGGYCIGSGNFFYRGGCTDQTWTSTGCPALCATGTIVSDPYGLFLTKPLTHGILANMDNFINFYPCSTNQSSLDDWVCGETGGNNCNLPSFHFEPGSIFEPQVEAVVATSTVTVMQSATVLPSATNTAATLPEAASCPSSNGTIIGIGVSLGAVLGLSAIAALGGFLVERRKRKLAETKAAQMQASSFYQNDVKEYPVGKLAYEAGSETVYELGHNYGTK
jgi:hypothetical protein